METDQRESALPTDSEARKGLPMATGVLDYFPAALAAVAELSKVGNDKHNPGEPLHWARGKSMDHADTIMRHLAERGTVDTDGMLHDVKVAWRALAMLQEELEKRGAPMSRGSRVAETPAPPKPRLPSVDTLGLYNQCRIHNCRTCVDLERAYHLSDQPNYPANGSQRVLGRQA